MASQNIIDVVARAICVANNENPLGVQVRFLDDGMHEETFLKRNGRGALYAINAVRNAIQAHAESLPIDEYTPWRQCVEWLDRQIAIAKASDDYYHLTADTRGHA